MLNTPPAPIPEGFKLYDGPRDRRFLPGAMARSQATGKWLQTLSKCLGAFANPDEEIIVRVEFELQSAIDHQEGGTRYKDFAIQPVDFNSRNNLTFLEECVIKRVCRHRAKNGAEDIRKAIHELQLILELEYGTK